MFLLFKEWSAKLTALWFFLNHIVQPYSQLTLKIVIYAFHFHTSKYSLHHRQKHVYNWWMKAKQRTLRDYTMSAGMCGYMCAPIYKIFFKKQQQGLLSTNERTSSLSFCHEDAYTCSGVWDTSAGWNQTGTCIINNTKIWGMLHPTLFLINQPRRPSPGQMLDMHCQSTILQRGVHRPFILHNKYQYFCPVWRMSFTACWKKLLCPC